MKTAIIIGCIFLHSFAMAQRKTDFKSLVLGDYNYAYNTGNSNFYYKQAQSLLELNNPDSLSKASKIMWGLYMFDTLKYSFEGFVPLLNKIVQSNTQYYGNLLKGTWRFNYDFVDGFGSTVHNPTDTLRTVTFDGHYAYFYTNDSLYKKMSYSIKSYQAGFEFQRVNTYNISFHDSDEKWWFTDFDPKRLSIKLNYPCACGCTVQVYKKIEENARLTGNKN